MNAGKLRRDLRDEAIAFARKRNLPIDISHSSAAIFENLADGFHPESFGNILNNQDWNKRTRKSHPQVRDAFEMQSSNSSDALLMNIFCHPSIGEWRGVGKMMEGKLESFEFGYPARVRLKDGQSDTTEIDLALPAAFCEAKLTETDFTQKEAGTVERYESLESEFHVELLPRRGSDFENYQVIRNLLASVEQDRDHILFCDARRPDLARRYFETVACLRDSHRRVRCRVIFWQEIVAACGEALQEWIEERYGMGNKS